MNSEYLILDPRPLEAFRDKTFSGFKKKEVYKALLKSIDTGKVEEACYWVTECICSGYCRDVLEKCLIHASKVIHINSPSLPMLLLRKYRGLMNAINDIPSKEKHRLIHLRNTQEVRNNMIDVVVTLSTAPKTKRYDVLPKVDGKTDFQFAKIKEKMNATMHLLPGNVIKFTDPEELRIIMNEIFFNLKNSNGGYEKVCYWIEWLVQWEKRNKSRKQTYEIEERPIQGVDPKHCKDVIWLVWELVFEECGIRSGPVVQPIQSLFQLFRENYTCGKRHARLPYLYHSIGYLTLPVNYKIPVRPRHDIFIMTQCNVNIWFKGKKSQEVQTYVEPPKPPKKLKGAEKEIVESRMKELADLSFH